MTKIDSLIKQREVDGYKFKPSLEFFRTIGIGRKRFWMIARGSTDPTVPEIKAIANHFGVDYLELI